MVGAGAHRRRSRRYANRPSKGGGRGRSTPPEFFRQQRLRPIPGEDPDNMVHGDQLDIITLTHDKTREWVIIDSGYNVTIMSWLKRPTKKYPRGVAIFTCIFLVKGTVQFTGRKLEEAKFWKIMASRQRHILDLDPTHRLGRML